MKTIILAGGLGTRLAEETVVRPKPMVEIGGRPILWHLMNIYGMQGFDEFVIALGYKGDLIKKYFMDYYALHADLTVNLKDGKNTNRSGGNLSWMIDLIDTGYETQTGGRIKRLKNLIDGQTFMATYADGLAKIDLHALLAFHRSHGKLATVTTVHPPSRFGKIVMDGDRVTKFSEKPKEGDGWINGGYYVFEPEVLDYIDGDLTVLEREPLERLAAEGQLMAYRHEGFWQMMDTLQEKLFLENLWNNRNAPWMETV